MQEWSEQEKNEITARTRLWLERAVIGLNLCPFAKAVHVKKQIRYAVSGASNADELLEDLIKELQHLHSVPAEQIETTFLIHPAVLNDFMDYNDFLGLADLTLEQLDLDGEIQIASFHPDYQFSDVEPDDITNFTNRSPYPILHLLREASVTRAVESFPEADAIYLRNIGTMRALGMDGWKKLLNGEGN